MSQPRPRLCLEDALQPIERALALSGEHLRQGSFAASEAHLAQFQGDAYQLYSLALAWPDEARVSHLALCAALLCKGLSERDPARRSALLRWLREQPPLTGLPSRVAAALPRDGALIEYVAFRPLALEPDSSSSRPASTPRYLALLLRADGSTGSVDLGPAAPLDAAALLLHRVLASRFTPSQPAAQALYTLAFHPLLSRLGPMRRLFIAPDRWLALAPFTELHDGERFLSDAIDITLLTSGRDLLPGPEGLPRRRPMIVLTSLDPVLPPEAPS